MSRLCLVVMLNTSAALASGAEDKMTCPNGGSGSTCSMDDDVNLLQTRTKVHMHAKHGKDGLSLKIPVHPKDRVGWDIHAGSKGPVSILKKDLTAQKATTETLTDSDVKEIKDILKEASNLTGDTEALKVEEELEDADATGLLLEDADATGGHDALGDLVQGSSKDHQEMMTAIEEVSAGEDPEDMLADTGSIITGDVLKKLDDLPDTPEQLPSNATTALGLGLLNVNTSLVVEGDMMGRIENDTLMLLQASAAHK